MRRTIYFFTCPISADCGPSSQSPRRRMSPIGCGREHGFRRCSTNTHFLDHMGHRHVGGNGYLVGPRHSQGFEAGRVDTQEGNVMGLNGFDASGPL
jgi:hypothetical protein